MTVKIGMKWASAISTDADTDKALDDVLSKITTDLHGEKPDVAFLFISPQHRANYARAGAAVNKRLEPQHLLGCSGGAVIGGGREVEHAPAISITAAILPDVTITPFHLDDDTLPGLDDPPRKWEEAIAVHAADNPHFVIVADPYSMSRAEDMLRGFDYAFPQSAKIGGLASGANGPGQNALYLDRTFRRTGAVGLAFSGEIEIDTLVAQGCRPIGKPMRITSCQKNLLVELDKKPALLALQELFEAADEREQDLIRSSLFLGIVMDPFKAGEPLPGDFLIRNLVGMDANRGVLAIGALLDEGQTVQFHLRESAAATADLEAVLWRHSTERMNAMKGESLPTPPRGGLLFSCLGRGEGLYGKPDHDSLAFANKFVDAPLGGFFCNGEIGPVGGTTYIHGFTSCFGIFRNKD
ncbi:MAG: FIST N-terminal domain-containing protein [Planctomycetota bacterium]